MEIILDYPGRSYLTTVILTNGMQESRMSNRRLRTDRTDWRNVAMDEAMPAASRSIRSKTQSLPCSLQKELAVLAP